MNELAFPGVWLTTLEALKRHRGLNSETVPEDSKYAPEEADALLADCIRDASASIIDEIDRLPLPHCAAPEVRSNAGRTLYLPEDLLEVTEVTDADDVVVSADDYTLAPLNTYPKHSLELVRNCQRYAWASLNCCGSGWNVTVSGVYGYVPHWPRAWRASGQLLPTGGLPDSSAPATLTLTDVSAFQTGQYGRIGDEYVQFTMIDREAKQVMLDRALLGTSASGHDAGAAIELFQQHADIQAKTTEWAAYLYKKLDSLGEQLQVFDGNVQVVNGLSPLIKRALRKHKRM
jgi:hypothetical protein